MSGEPEVLGIVVLAAIGAVVFRDELIDILPVDTVLQHTVVAVAGFVAGREVLPSIISEVVEAIPF